MAAIDFYWARGNGEPFGGSMYSNVARLLDKSIFDIREVSYSAWIRPNITEANRTFRAWMERNKDPERPWMGGGYSLGGTLMGNYVGQLHLSKCKGMGLLSDGMRHRDQIYGTRKPKGWGAGGQRRVGYAGGYPVWTLSAVDDPISEMPGDCGLRNLAPFLGFPPQPRPAREADAFYSMHWMGLFFPGNRHTNYHAENMPGTNETYTRALAREINTEGRRLVKAGLV